MLALILKRFKGAKQSADSPTNAASHSSAEPQAESAYDSSAHAESRAEVICSRDPGSPTASSSPAESNSPSHPSPTSSASPTSSRSIASPVSSPASEDLRPLFAGVAVYCINGEAADLLFAKVELALDDVGVRSCDEDGDLLSFKYEEVSHIRQESSQTVQFILHRGKEPEERGCRFRSESNAFEFRDILLRACWDLSTPICPEMDCTVTIHNPDKGDRETWQNGVSFQIRARITDFVDMLLIGLCGSDESIFLEVAAHNNVILCGVDCLTFLGPFTKHDPHRTAMRRSMGVQIVGTSPRSLDRIGDLLIAATAECDRENFGGFDSERSSSEESGDENLWEPGSKSRRYISDDQGKVHRFMQVGEARSCVFRSIEQAGSRLTPSESDVYVYENDPVGGELHNVAMIGGAKLSYDGHKLQPGKGILHSSERKLLFTSVDEPNVVYQFDVERETVSGKFCAKSLSVDLMLNSHKGGSITHDPTFLCGNSSSIFQMDTRMKNPVGASRTYATDPGFTAASTDSQGHVVMGDRDGNLRLFDGEANASGDFKIAKTLLETRYKTPVKSLDVTADGSWILATLPTCIALFPVKLKDSGQTGFTVRLGDKKPQGLYLRAPEEVLQEYGLKEVDFSPAVFDKEEATILTSTGHLALCWDFRAMKKGIRKPPSVKVASQPIKDTRALSSGAVVVAYPTDVDVLGIKTRKKGSRQSVISSPGM